MGINNPEKPPDPRQATAYLLQHFKDDYGLFWKIKLNNFAACVQRWPALWKLFSDIDHLIAAEIEVCESLTQERQLYPQFLFIRSHAQFRLALELAFSLALTEAESLMRVAIESAVNGFELYKEPHLLDSWLGREEESLKKVYDSHFVANRRKNLFTGLPELDLLYTMWCDYSERSSHTSMSDLHLRIELKEAGTDDTLRHAGLHYFERNLDLAEMRIIKIAGVMLQIEKLFFRIFSDRFRLVPRILTQRDMAARLFQQVGVEQKARLPGSTTDAY